MGSYIPAASAGSASCTKARVSSALYCRLRVRSVVGAPPVNAVQNGDAADLYGFFHGHDYYGALADFVQISGKTIMVPKYVSGIWWSRWYDLNNLDVVKVADDYASRSIPLDVFVIDMVRWYGCLR